MVIETARLVLRGWRDSDHAPFAAMGADADVMQWLGGLQSRAQIDDTVQRLNRIDDEFGYTFWALERKADGGFLGFCGIKPIQREIVPGNGTPEIGWRLRKDAWGQGYARESAVASMSYGFDQFDFDFISALTLPANEASWGLMKRLGMMHRPELDYFDEEEWGPKVGKEIVYRITRDEWAEKRKEFAA